MIFVIEDEYNDFKIRRDKENRVWLFWMDIMSNAPDSLSSEIQSSFINLEEQSPNKFKITGVSPFQFVPNRYSSCTDKLVKYLKEFVVFVEFRDQKRLTEWNREFFAESLNFVSKYNAAIKKL